MKKEDGLWIVGDIAELNGLKDISPDFARAVEFIISTDLASLEDGRHKIDSDRVFVSVAKSDLRDVDTARSELHLRYFDIHIPFSGDEIVGVARFDRETGDEFDRENDFGFYDGFELERLKISPGQFALIYPGVCLHAPCCSSGDAGSIRKAVVKILA